MNNYIESFFLEPTTKYEIESENRKLKAKTYSGYENISPRIIKKVSNVISEPLAHVFNLTFLNGAIPEKPEIALVTPI